MKTLPVNMLNEQKYMTITSLPVETLDVSKTTARDQTK